MVDFFLSKRGIQCNIYLGHLSFPLWNFTAVTKINTSSELGIIPPANIYPSNNTSFWNRRVSSRIITDHIYYVIIMACPSQVSHHHESSLYISMYPFLLLVYVWIVLDHMLIILGYRRRRIFY